MLFQNVMVSLLSEMVLITSILKKSSKKLVKHFFALISKCKELNGLQPGLFLYLFDQMIVPIINYGSEIWGFD